MGGCRRPAYAVAAFAFLGILSVSLAEQTHVPAETGSRVPVFEGADTLLRPEGYENWILVGEAMGTHPGVASRTGHDTRPSTHGVYINPSSYREYVKTGRFPDGTLMVWQSEGALLTSVKDTTRFDGGWGFFDFSRVDGTVAGKARPVSESSGCRTCHQREAQTDHVFTQFYPVLQTARRAVQFAGPADKGRSADASNAFIPTSLPRYGRTASV